MKSIMRWMLSVSAFLLAVFSGYGGTVTTDNLTVNQNATFYGEVNMVKPGPPSNNGMMLYYDFDTTTDPIPDVSGNNNVGTLYNAMWIDQGKINGAYDFNGANAWIRAAHAESINMSGALTVAAWINPDVVSSCMNVVSKSSGNGNTAFGWLLDLRGSRIYPVIKTISGAIYQFSGNTVLPLNQWSHVAITYDGTTLVAYLNGVADGSKPASGNIDNSANYNLGIGWLAQGGVSPQLFNGRIDEVKLFNRALPAYEIAALAGISIDTSSGGRLTVSDVISGNSISQVSPTAINTFMGRIGINTEVPSEMLDVNGNVVVRGTITGDGVGLANLKGQAIIAGTVGNAQLRNGAVDVDKLNLGSVDARYLTQSGDNTMVGNFAIYNGSAWIHTPGGRNQANLALGEFTDAPGQPLYTFMTDDDLDQLQIHSYRWSGRTLFTRGSPTEIMKEMDLTSGAGGTWLTLFGPDSDNTPKVVLSSSSDSLFNGGNVGIGLATPSAKLHVNGTAKFEQGIDYIAPRGNLDMGTFTARP